MASTVKQFSLWRSLRIYFNYFYRCVVSLVLNHVVCWHGREFAAQKSPGNWLWLIHLLKFPKTWSLFCNFKRTIRNKWIIAWHVISLVFRTTCVYPRTSSLVCVTEATYEGKQDNTIIIHTWIRAILLASRVTEVILDVRCEHSNNKWRGYC